MSRYNTQPNNRDSYNPLRGLSMSRIVAMEEAATRGDVADVQWFWSHMERTDVTVAAAVKARLSHIEALDWEIRSIETADQVLAQEQAEVLRYAYDRIENLSEAATRLAYGNFTGFSILEKVKTGYGPFVKRLEYLPCWFWTYDTKEKAWRFNPESRSGIGQGEPVDEKDLIIHETEAPLFKPIGRHFFSKQLSLADWDIALENGANQAVFLVGPPGATEEQELKYQSLAEAMASNLRGYLPNGADAKIVDLAARQQLPYFARIEYSDKQIVQAATGGLLTMLAESGTGTLAGGAHSETLMGLARADAQRISEVFQKQFDKDVLRAFFPEYPVSAYFKFDIPKQEATLAQLIEAISALSWAGYKINQQQLEEKLGFKLEQIQPPGA